jgi:long-chain acyl-CoA synthetase
MVVAHPWEKSYPRGVRWDSPLEITTLTGLLDRAVQGFADKIAIEYRDNEISYGELGRTTEALAAGLSELGVSPGTSVALYLPNTPYHPYFFFAVLKAGGRIVHLSPLDAERELAHKLDNSGAKMVVTTNVGALLPMARKLKAQGLFEHLIVCDDAAFGPAGAPATPVPDAAELLRFETLRARGAQILPLAWPALSVDDVALLQYTGGTTGKPKAAMLTHANLTSTISIYKIWGDAQRQSEPGTDKVICVLPLFHIYALTSVLLRGLRDGNEIMLRMRFDVETTLRDIEVKRATAFPGVPTMWIALVNTPGIEKRDFSSLRFVGSGGAGIPIEVAEKFYQLTGQRMGGGWGMTETSPAGTSLPKNGAHKPGSCGLPLPGVLMDVVALNDPRRVLKAGEIGEIRIKGPNVTRGYFNAPEDSAAAFVDGWFLTGDIGYMDEDGFFYIVDRKKDMIISGGFNVYPRAIEEAIYEHPAVAEVSVIGVPDSYRGEAAKAFIQLKSTREPFTLEELRAFLADKLGRHELPAQLEFRDALPKTAVGKLSKKELIAEERQKRLAATE